mgnify:CR=1 FL=1
MLPKSKFLPLFCLLLLVMCRGAAAPATSQSNTIAILAGDMAHGDVGPIGSRVNSTPESAPGVLDEAWGVGSWIWTTNTFEKQRCRLWRSFEIPRGAAVTAARLHISADDAYKLMLDGRELGVGIDWRYMTEYDLSQLLTPGWHVLAVEVFNETGAAGLLAGLKIELADGVVLEIPSDTNWRIVPAAEEGWEYLRQSPPEWHEAVVVNAFGEGWRKDMPKTLTRMPTLHPVRLKFWQQGWFQITLLAVVGLAVLVCLQLMARLAVQSKAQALLHRERARIARDLHDELGAGITQLALQGEVAQTELPPGSDARAKFEAFCEKARALSGAMDEIVWVVNSRRDTLRDFATYACKYARRFMAPTAIRCRLDVDSELPDAALELPVRRNLLLAVKEALNNAAKYSGATELFLRVQLRGQTLLVAVEDNGRGFDLKQADAARNGLTNMNERMREVGGQCRITTQPGAGCRVEFEVALPKSARRSSSPDAHLEHPVARYNEEQGTGTSERKH